MKDIFKKLEELDELTNQKVIHSVRFTADEGWEFRIQTLADGSMSPPMLLGVGVQAFREHCFTLKQKYIAQANKDFGATFGMGY